MEAQQQPFVVVLDLSAQDAYDAITAALSDFWSRRSEDAADSDAAARENASYSEAVRLNEHQAALARKDAAAARALLDDIERQLDERHS